MRTIGLHKGEDTEFYLKKGFEVIAFEAYPVLADQCRRKFSTQIAEQRLVIVEGAIIDAAACGSATTVKFYRNETDTYWGTIFPEWAERNKDAWDSRSTMIEVPAVNLGDCLRRYGVPHYMKIDIEGADVFCLRSLLDSPIRPDYVSIESEKRDFRKLIEEFQLLERLGYSRFKAVQQYDIQTHIPPSPSLEGQYVDHLFPEGSSGLFGRDLPGRWKTRREVLREYRWIFLLYRLFGDFGKLKNSKIGDPLRWGLVKLLRQPVPGWYDTHARHSTTSIP